MDRYHRQILLPGVGPTGQRRLLCSRVLLIGCGALGATIADQLTRAGVGHLRIVDRDIVELTNLQRQSLFDEQDVRQSVPKSIAAVNRLMQINSEVEIVPIVADVHAGNIERLAGFERGESPVDLILDGTDNVQTRYLINDVAVKHSVAWIYGACVGIEGRMMAIAPPATACLRCVFPNPSLAGELPTCDTAGVLGPSAALVASLQSAQAIRRLCGVADNATATQLVSFDLWTNCFRTTPVNEKNPDCVTCGQKRFEFLLDRSSHTATALCGRNAVQVRPPATQIDLDALSNRLASSGDVSRTAHLLKVRLRDPSGVTLTIFPDARAVIHGIGDAARARSIYARYVGA